MVTQTQGWCKAIAVSTVVGALLAVWFATALRARAGTRAGGAERFAVALRNDRGEHKPNHYCDMTLDQGSGEGGSKDYRTCQHAVYQQPIFMIDGKAIQFADRNLRGDVAPTLAATKNDLRDGDGVSVRVLGGRGSADGARPGVRFRLGKTQRPSHHFRRDGVEGAYHLEALPAGRAGTDRAAGVVVDTGDVRVGASRYRVSEDGRTVRVVVPSATDSREKGGLLVTGSRDGAGSSSVNFGADGVLRLRNRDGTGGRLDARQLMDLQKVANGSELTLDDMGVAPHAANAISFLTRSVTAERGRTRRAKIDRRWDVQAPHSDRTLEFTKGRGGVYIERHAPGSITGRALCMSGGDCLDAGAVPKWKGQNSIRMRTRPADPGNDDYPTHYVLARSSKGRDGEKMLYERPPRSDALSRWTIQPV